MKKIISILFLGACTLFITSCSDFMDLNPTTQPSDETFWKTENDFNMALAGIYGDLRSNNYFNAQYGLWDALTDNMYAGHNEGATGDICRGNVEADLGGYVRNIFTSAYSSLARINIFLEHVEANQSLSADVKKRMLGEGKFFRAFHHMFLFLCYGDVPIVSKMLSLDEQYPAKEPAEKVYENILADFDEAINDLPDVTYAEGGGHTTKSAAKAFKAKVMLQHAYTKGVANQEEMKQIVSLLESISGYALQPTYSDLFEDKKQEESPEIMFSVKNLAPNSCSGLDMYMTNWLMYCPLRNLVDEFEMKGEGSWLSSEEAKQINEEILNSDDVEAAERERAKLFVNRDARLSASIFHSMHPFPELRYIAGETDFTGFGCYKYLQRDQTLAAGDLLDGEVSPQDMILMRYGYVLLMIAEAENEVNGPTAKVYDAVNQIRQRAGQNVLPTGLSQAQMREKIRHEWRVETAFEGLHYFEMKRWHTLGDIVKIKDPKFTDYQPRFEERFYLWPIPQSEIDKAHGALEQNPDYQ